MSAEQEQAMNAAAEDIRVEDEIEGLRLAEDLQYVRNRAAFGKPSLDLFGEYTALYDHLWHIATAAMPLNPIQEANLFAHQMLLECRADLARTMLLLLRTHLIEAHAQTRRAIECCAWARRVHHVPALIKEWLNTDMQRPPSRTWKENIKTSLLFPTDSQDLHALRGRYQLTSRCVHPFRFSVEGRTAIQQDAEGAVSLIYSFFDPDDIRIFLPTRFLWTLQTHDLIFNVFEEVFAREVEVQAEEWQHHRTQVTNAQTEVARFWIATTERVKARRRERSDQ
jgi:hypothetical protein